MPLVVGNTSVCNHTVSTTHMVGDSSSSAEFFVGIAIVCFLYSMVALLVYLGYMHVYKDSDLGPILVSIDPTFWFSSISHQELQLLSVEVMFLLLCPGLCDHSDPGLPVAGVFICLGQGSAEREGRHEH